MSKLRQIYLKLTVKKGFPTFASAMIYLELQEHCDIETSRFF